MKKNSGSALTSVMVVFLLVTMIGVPLLSMVVYNYRLREYDSGIKEAEYNNEVVMDRIATIIKNEVIAAISEAKNSKERYRRQPFIRQQKCNKRFCADSKSNH